MPPNATGPLSFRKWINRSQGSRLNLAQVWSWFQCDNWIFVDVEFGSCLFVSSFIKPDRSVTRNGVYHDDVLIFRSCKKGLASLSQRWRNPKATVVHHIEKTDFGDISQGYSPGIRHLSWIFQPNWPWKSRSRFQLWMLAWVNGWPDSTTMTPFRHTTRKMSLQIIIRHKKTKD